MVRPGEPAVCFGTVVHHRLEPLDHRFTYPVTMVWLDPDHPDELCRHHPLWSATRPAPIWIRRRDYLCGNAQPLGAAIRRELAGELGRSPSGPLRMLTQPRTWGWLFNPITIYLAWEQDVDAGPTAALLEVTNTPWKERHLYAVELQPGPADPGGPRFRARFDKALHVSPFLGERYRYELQVSSSERPADATEPRSTTPPEQGGPSADSDNPTRRLTVTLDVVAPERIQHGISDELLDNSHASRVVLATRLSIDHHPVERAVLSQALRNNPMPTHRVSIGIHRQALALWRRGVPVVAHPRRRARQRGATEPMKARASTEDAARYPLPPRGGSS